MFSIQMLLGSEFLYIAIEIKLNQEVDQWSRATWFTHCSGVSIADFKQISACWGLFLL